MLSTRDLSHLPKIETLRHLMQSLAVLDAIMSRVWEYRCFSYNSHWAPDIELGSMRNGQGDHLYAAFDSAGCWIKGFDHECALDRPGVPGQRSLFGKLPMEFHRQLNEPAFAISESTFCIWRKTGPFVWEAETDAPGKDGSTHLMRNLDGNPETYRQWAAEYYEKNIPISVVRAIYEHRPLEAPTIAVANSKYSIESLASDLIEIGYPPVVAS